MLHCSSAWAAVNTIILNLVGGNVPTWLGGNVPNSPSRISIQSIMLLVAGAVLTVRGITPGGTAIND